MGTFTWQSVNTDVALLDVATDAVPVTGLVRGQVKVTAHTPGITSLFASTSNVTSQPFDFKTCAVQSIALAVTGSTSNSINVTSGNGKTVTATVVDTQGNTITVVPLTWSSSDPPTVAVGTSGCDYDFAGGRRNRDRFLHSADLQYRIESAPADLSPERRRRDGRSATTTTTTTTTTTVYVSSTGVSSSPPGNCATTTGCISLLIPIASPNNTVGTAVGLPATPNSLVFDRQGAKAYMGTDYSFFGSRGLMQDYRRQPAHGHPVQVRDRKSPHGFARREESDPFRAPIRTRCRSREQHSSTRHPGDRVRYHQQYQHHSATLRVQPRPTFPLTISRPLSPPAPICMCGRRRIR